MHSETRVAHALPVRVLHWANAAIVATLVTTGLLIYDKFHERLTQRVHVDVAVVFAAIGVSYVAYLVISRRWQMPKYQGLQRLAYTAVLLMAAGEGLTGIALYFRRRLPGLVHVLGGRHMVLTEHLTLTFAILAFVAVHLVQVVRSGWPTLTSMIDART